MSRLEVTIKLAVKEDIDKFDPNEEIYLRSLVMEIKNLVSLVGRGKYDIETKHDRPTKNRRLSVRKPKSKGASNG